MLPAPLAGQASCSSSQAAQAPSCSGAALVQRGRRRLRRRHRRMQAIALASPDVAADLLHQALHHGSLAYERVVGPCQNMNCGDVMHRSTLDPVLRLEQRGITWQAVALVVGVLSYLFARPGILEGAIDYYVLERFDRKTRRTYSKDDFQVGKKLAEGGFGTVFKALLYADEKEPIDVIIKKAKEFGEAEVWMNERLMRAAPQCFAAFITAFEAGATPAQRFKEPLWLVWRDEGDFTLWDLMQRKDFPYNLEPLLLGRELPMAKGPRRRAITLRIVFRQICEALAACHRTGIVHRDVKPQNVIVSVPDRRVKFIDLGAAADLRIGINYVPNEYLLDPRYAPPEQYVMSTSTPRAPPLPVAAFLSPILWQLNKPDRFDMYSAGMTLLQMAMPGLRSDNALLATRDKLERFDYDMEAWRAYEVKRGDRQTLEGLETLDQDGGAPWQLLVGLMRKVPTSRTSAARALSSRWLAGEGLTKPLASALAFVGDLTDKVAGSDSWLEGGLAGGRRDVGLSEAQLSDELGGQRVPIPRASNTISWWRVRQAAVQAGQDRQGRVQAARELKRARGRGPEGNGSSPLGLPKLFSPDRSR